MTTDDTLTITDRLIEAVRATPGAGSGWIARAIGSDDIYTCSALLHKLVKRGVLRREGESRAFRYYIGDLDAPEEPESTPEEPAAPAVNPATAGPTWTRPAPERCDDELAGDETLRDALSDALRESFAQLDESGCAWTLVVNEHGHLAFVTRAGPLVTLTTEQTQRLGRFLAFTMPLWEAA